MNGKSGVEGMSCVGGCDGAARGSTSCKLLPPARDHSSLRPCVIAAWVPDSAVSQLLRYPAQSSRHDLNWDWHRVSLFRGFGAILTRTASDHSRVTVELKAQ